VSADAYKGRVFFSQDSLYPGWYLQRYVAGSLVSEALRAWDPSDMESARSEAAEFLGCDGDEIQIDGDEWPAQSGEVVVAPEEVVTPEAEVVPAHTPGPWSYQVISPEEIAIFRRWGEAAGEVVAQILGQGNLQTAAANSRLIAQAPELLEAAQELLKLDAVILAAPDLRLDERRRLESIFGRLRRAVQRAEGLEDEHTSDQDDLPDSQTPAGVA
jgi:hypothetical protein